MTNLTNGRIAWCSIWATALCVACAGNDVTGANAPSTSPTNYDAIGSGKVVFVRMFGPIATPQNSVVLLDGQTRSERSIYWSGGGVAVSPDGQRIAYSQAYSFLDPFFGKFTLWQTDIVVRDVAWGYETRVTDDTDYQELPTWAPNGEELMYRSSWAGSVNGAYWQTSARLDGVATKRRLLELSATGCPDVAGAAVLSVRDELAFSCGALVYTKPANSGQSAILPIDGNLGELQAIAWSPDGLRLAYVEFLGAHLVLKTVTREGKSPTTLASVPSTASNHSLSMRQSLCWTADGARLFFNVTKGNASSQIWVVRSDGTGLLQLTNVPGAFDYNVSCT